MLHPIAWVVWTVSGAVAATMTRNPLYLAILLGIVGIQYTLASRQPLRGTTQGWRALLRLTMTLALLFIPFNALTVHAGTHTLFRLPSAWPLIGGDITLEAVVWGATTSLGLLALMVLFATFNLSVGQAQILNLTPAFIYEAGLVVSIALTFVPQMLVSAREIREAQLIRGHRMRRARDMLPLLMARFHLFTPVAVVLNTLLWLPMAAALWFGFATNNPKGGSPDGHGNSSVWNLWPAPHGSSGDRRSPVFDPYTALDCGMGLERLRGTDDAHWNAVSSCPPWHRGQCENQCREGGVGDTHQ